MNPNQQPTGNDQARNAQSSGLSQLSNVGITPSEAARLLAARRSELRQQQAPTGPEADAGSAPDEIEPPDGDEIETEALAGDGLADDDADAAEGLAPEEGNEQPEDDGAVSDDAVLVLDGDEITIGEIKQWREGAMRQADYQRKTQVLAQKAEAISQLEERLNGFSHAINRDFQSRMEAAAKALKPFSEIDWAKLAETNPQQYNAQKVRFEQARAAAMAVQQQWNNFLKEYEELAQQSLQLRAKAALPEIKARIKGWDDAMYAERLSFVQSTYGAEPSVLTKVVDPWFWEMANDAYKYRQGQALPEKLKSGKQVVKPIPKALQKGAARTMGKPQTVSSVQKQLQSLPLNASQSQREALAVKLLQARRGQAMQRQARS